jgi:hypothetical protein
MEENRNVHYPSQAMELVTWQHPARSVKKNQREFADSGSLQANSGPDHTK